jgi:heterodisulfide reductase subunit A
MKIGVYICHCGTNIAATVDVKEVAEYAKNLPNVAVSKDYVYMCSDPGQELIKEDIIEEELERVVVASCSPTMHEPTFRRTCEEAGLNRYCFEMANVREQCSWVHRDIEEATQKAKDLVASAVAKASLLEPLEPMTAPVTPAALVMGGGIAGIYASLDIADAGFQVYLVDREPSIGGHMAQLDKTFPTLDCSACILTPKMVDVARHPNIELITYAEVESVEGYIGNFNVRVRKKARYVDEDRCTGCGECANACPQPRIILNEFELGLANTAPAYVPFPQAVPMVYTIEKREGKPPCEFACPAGVNVQGYVALVSQGRYKEAVDLIRERNPLPAICGHVCPHPCEDECNRGEFDESIAIAALKRFAADRVVGSEEDIPPPVKEKKDKKIAVIGSGPAGLTAAYYLAKEGYFVKIYEKLPLPGGMLAVGIPTYRLPREVLRKDIDYIKGMGIEIETNVEIDKEKFEKLRKDYDTIFISVGSHISTKLGVEGEDLEGVIHGVDFLRDLDLGKEVKIGRKVAVIGGGDVAIDAARCALRLGSNVTIIYRRSREEMPAREEEVRATEEEGIEINFLATPVKILGSSRVEKMECIRMELGPLDETGRRRPIPIEGSKFLIDVDTVIPAIGQASDLRFLEGSDVNAQNGRWIEADEDGLTSEEGIFAGGDAVTGPATVIEAIAVGRRAAGAINRYLKGEVIGKEEKEEEKIGIEEVELPEEEEKRVEMPKLPIKERINNFDEVELGFTEEEAVREANRCLHCKLCCECGLCEKACDADAINHEMTDEISELDVGAIVVATGYDLFDPSEYPEYGYKYDEVITGLEFERLCNAAGPTGGKIEVKASPNRHFIEPKKVVFISCVGSREKGGERPYCSRICCMYTAKQAHLVKEHIPGASVSVFYTDMRAFGKGFEEFWWRVENEGIEYIRRELTDPIKVEKENGVLKVKTMSEGKPIEKEADLVVLATAVIPKKDVLDTTRLLRITQSADKFFLEAHPKLRPVDTLTDGIFVAGCCQSPKDIPDSVAQASAAASRACGILSKDYIETEPIIAKVDELLCRGCGTCEEACEYGAIKVEEIKPMVLAARVNDVLCKGCGVCSVSCPSRAITCKHFTNDQINMMIEVML